MPIHEDDLYPVSFSSLFVLLPPPPFDLSTKADIVYRLQRQFAARQITFLNRKTELDEKYYASISNGILWLDSPWRFEGSEPDAVIILENLNGAIAMGKERIDALAQHYPCYRWYQNFKMLLPWGRPSINKIDDPGANKHFFSRVAIETNVSRNEFVYFPYGFFVRSTMLGNINEFGFRVDDDYQRLVSRCENHKLICVTGGSAAWGCNVHIENTFCRKLEKLLNAERGEVHYHVLNFGMSGYTVINEMITYMLFIAKLQPDIVLSFSGFNDIHMGLTSDEYLLKKFDIAYSGWQEGWASVLRDVAYSPDFELGWSLSKHTLPYNTQKAFLSRISQYRDIVEKSGTKFIFALQPFWGSKGAHSKNELKSFTTLYQRSYEHPMVSAIGYMYNRLKKVSEEGGVEIDIDFDRYFGGLDDSIDAIYDLAHFMPEGESIVAKYIYEWMVAHVEE